MTVAESASDIPRGKMDSSAGKSSKNMSVLACRNGLSFLQLKEGKAAGITRTGYDGQLPDFKKTEVDGLFIDNRYFTLVPNELKADAARIAADVFGFDNGPVMVFDFKEFSLIQGLEKETEASLNRIFAGLPRRSWAALTLEKWMQQAAEGEQLFIDVREGYFNAAVFKDGALQLFNSYKYSGLNDFGFFAIGLAKNHNFNPGSMKYYLTGNISYGSSAFQLLQRYLGKPAGFNKELKEEVRLFELLLNDVKK